MHRGAERELHELAGRLVDAGHKARVLTGAPHGLIHRAVINGAPVHYVRSPRRAGWPEPGPGIAAAAFAETLRTRPDVVHSLHYADAAGAARARRPVILKLTGTVLPDRMEGIDERLLRSALERSAEVWCNSTWAAEQMTGFGVPMRVVPAGVDTSRFRPHPRSPYPLVLCAAAADEPRKRVADLLVAWPEVHAALPGARLMLAGTTKGTSLDGVECLGQVPDAELAALYAKAWVVVAPAVHEALGLVTLEALSAGTPVAGARSGATTELLADPRTGVLSTPGDADSLAAAILAATELAHDPETAGRCREVALRYDWDQVLPMVLEGYARVRR